MAEQKKIDPPGKVLVYLLTLHFSKRFEFSHARRMYGFEGMLTHFLFAIYVLIISYLFADVKTFFNPQAKTFFNSPSHYLTAPANHQTDNLRGEF